MWSNVRRFPASVAWRSLGYGLAALLVASAGQAQIPADRFEANDSVADATSVGVEPQPDLSIDTASDVDFFRVTPDVVGALVVKVRFAHAAGDLSVEVLTTSGFVVASGTSASDDEVVVLPTGRERTYYVRVFGASANVYDLEILEVPLPVATAPRLDPVSDTGESGQDAITSDDTPGFVLAWDLATFTLLGIPFSLGTGGLQFDIQLTGTNLDTGSGFSTSATQIGFQSRLFEAIPFAPLEDGRWLFTTNIQLVDGYGASQTPHGPATQVIIDDTAPPPPSTPTLLPAHQAYSPTLTRTTTPTLLGTAEPRARVRLLVNGEVAAAGRANSAGEWSLTLPALSRTPIPTYVISAEAEDAAGNVSAASGVVSVRLIP